MKNKNEKLKYKSNKYLYQENNIIDEVNFLPNNKKTKGANY
jgi:hypothetical protein